MPLMPPLRSMIRFLVPLVAIVLLVVVFTTSVRAETPVQIDISPTAACALLDTGEIDCWGFDIPLIHDVPDGAFTDLSIGPNDACAISTDGAAVCWGVTYASVRAKIDGLLARDPEADLEFVGLSQLVPPERNDLVQIVVHPWRHYACALTTQGDIDCWGLLQPPRAAPDADNFVQLINTGREFCALDTEGSTTCWGDLTIDRFVSDAGPFVSISASGNGLCGVTADGDVRCRTAQARTAPGPPQPFTQLFRNVHLLGSQGCAILDDGSIQCRQIFHQCLDLIAPEIDFCPPDLIRFQYWAIPFTILFEGGPDEDTTASRSYVKLFGDQAACAITTEGHIDCWSDFDDDPRHDVPERFRPLPPVDDSEPPAEEPADPAEDDQ